MPSQFTELMFVQFPHPGREHRPSGPEMEWNRGEHARKFLRASGRYVADGNVLSGKFAFWGEWEAQSRVVETYTTAGTNPQWLQDPFWDMPRHRALLQNTDPLVFGDAFLYSNCRQRRNAKLRHLAPGSLILFGSKLSGGFVLDTVFVVDRREIFKRASGPEGHFAEWVEAVVFEPLRSARGPTNEEFMLYWGRTYEKAEGAPYSFVPCRRLPGASVPFERPAIDLDRRWIEPNLAMGAKATPATKSDIGVLWREIVGQVTAAGLALGIELDAPPRGN